MVSATGGSPQIIQTHSGSQMTTTMAGAGGNNNLDLLKYSLDFLRRPQNLTKSPKLIWPFQSKFLINW